LPLDAESGYQRLKVKLDCEGVEVQAWRVYLAPKVEKKKSKSDLRRHLSLSPEELAA
jgi:hypothetical protein